MDHILYKYQSHFFSLYQGKDVMDQDYLGIFNATVAVLDQIGYTGGNGER